MIVMVVLLFHKVLPAGVRVHRMRFQIIRRLVFSPTMAAPLSTLGGCPLAVRSLATSAFIQLMIMAPPTVEPGRYRGIQSVHIDHSVSRGGTGIENQIGKVAQFFSIGTFAFAFFGMLFGENGDDEYPFLPE